MWRADLRGKGYGPRLFCSSALDFYQRFKLKRIICEPKADVAASSDLAFVCELTRYEILRDIADRGALAHAE